MRLPVLPEALSALARNVALALFPRSLPGLITITPNLTAPLCATLLSAPHGHGHEEHHKDDRNRDNDHDDAAANREHDKGDAHPASP